MAFARLTQEQPSQAVDAQPERYFIGENGREDALSRRMSRMNEQLRRLQERDWRPKQMLGNDGSQNGYAGPVSAVLSASLQAAKVTRQLSPRAVLARRQELIAHAGDGVPLGASMRSTSSNSINSLGTPVNAVQPAPCLRSGSSSPSQPPSGTVTSPLSRTQATYSRDGVASARRSGSAIAAVRRQSSSPVRSASPVPSRTGSFACSDTTAVSLRAAERALQAVGLRRSDSPQRGGDLMIPRRPAALRSKSPQSRQRSPSLEHAIVRARSPQDGLAAVRVSSPSHGHAFMRASSPQDGHAVIRASSPQAGNAFLRTSSPQHLPAVPRGSSPHRGSQMQGAPIVRLRSHDVDTSSADTSGHLSPGISSKLSLHLAHDLSPCSITASHNLAASQMPISPHGRIQQTPLETTYADAVQMHLDKSSATSPQGNTFTSDASHFAHLRGEVQQPMEPVANEALTPRSPSHASDSGILALRLAKAEILNLTREKGDAEQNDTVADARTKEQHAFQDVDDIPRSLIVRRSTAKFGADDDTNLQQALREHSLEKVLQERDMALQLAAEQIAQRDVQLLRLEEKTRELQEAQTQAIPSSVYSMDQSPRELSTSFDEENRRQRAQEAVRARVRNEVLRADTEILRTELDERDLAFSNLRRDEEEVQMRAAEVCRAAREEVAETLMQQQMLKAEMQEIELQRHFHGDRITKNSFLQLLEISPDTPASTQRARLATGLNLLRDLVSEFSENGTCFPDLLAPSMDNSVPAACGSNSVNDTGAPPYSWAPQPFEAMPSIPEESPRASVSTLSPRASPIIGGSPQCFNH